MQILKYVAPIARWSAAGVVFVFMTLGPGRVMADGAAKLDWFLHELTSVTADFSQVVHDADGRPGKASSGQLWIQRPGKFRWLYTKPYEQLIVVDGTFVWVWDKDLEQITKRPFSAHSGSMPAQLLSGQFDVKRSFSVTDIGLVSGVEWVELQPKSEEENFQKIRLGFDDSGLKTMRMVDNFGQTSVIEFTNLVSNNSLDPLLFAFDPPAGIDVISEE